MGCGQMRKRVLKVLFCAKIVGMEQDNSLPLLQRSSEGCRRTLTVECIGRCHAEILRDVKCIECLLSCKPYLHVDEHASVQIRRSCWRLRLAESSLCPSLFSSGYSLEIGPSAQSPRYARPDR